MGYRPWGHKELDTPERLSLSCRPNAARERAPGVLDWEYSPLLAAYLSASWRPTSLGFFSFKGLLLTFECKGQDQL